MSYTEYVARKAQIALEIAKGAGGGTYTEGATLLAALSSGISADIWPGERIDRKRFVELWATYADLARGALQISVPLLVAYLRGNGRILEADKIEGAKPGMFGPGYAIRVVTAEDVDMSEADVLALSPSLDLKTIRAFSYPAVFYEEVRCGLAHEYHLSGNATSNPMTSRPAHVSYSNRGNLTSSAIKRLIYFDLDWVARVITSTVSNFGPDDPRRLPLPAKWWIDG